MWLVADLGMMLAATCPNNRRAFSSQPKERALILMQVPPQVQWWARGDPEVQLVDWAVFLLDMGGVACRDHQLGITVSILVRLKWVPSGMWLKIAPRMGNIATLNSSQYNNHVQGRASF